MSEPGHRFEFTVKTLAFVTERGVEHLIAHVHEEGAVIVLKMGPAQRMMIERQIGKTAA